MRRHRPELGFLCGLVVWDLKSQAPLLECDRLQRCCILEDQTSLPIRYSFVECLLRTNALDEFHASGRQAPFLRRLPQEPLWRQAMDQHRAYN